MSTIPYYSERLRAMIYKGHFRERYEELKSVCYWSSYIINLVIIKLITIYVHNQNRRLYYYKS